MNAVIACETLNLKARDVRLVAQAAGTEVHCLEGRVWITQYGDSRDFVLSAGQRMVFELPTALVMSASQDARLSLRRGGALPRRTWAARLARLLDPRWSSRVTRALRDRLPGQMLNG